MIDHVHSGDVGILCLDSAPISKIYFITKKELISKSIDITPLTELSAPDLILE
jgi:hypothetical protein